MTGKVKSFSSKNGYGFITTDGIDYRFRAKQWELSSPPIEGMTVMFDPVKTDKGMRAVNIQDGV